MIIMINNDDDNDSNRKGKALKVATKKTLKRNEFFLPDFLKRDCFESLQFRFKNQLSLFCCNYFLFSYYYHYRHHYCFLLFSYYLFDFIFNLSYYMIFCLSIILLFFYLFFFLLFVSYFKFSLVPFSSFISFFAVFLSFCTSNESAIRCFICMSLFSVLSLLAFVNPPRRTTRPSKLPRKLKSLLPLLLCYYRSWAGQLTLTISLHPPIPIILRAIQPLAQSPPNQRPRGPWERGCLDPHEVLRYTYFYFKSQCKFHLLKNVIDTSSSPPLSSFATDITSL